jgi:hypothetical protein
MEHRTLIDTVRRLAAAAEELADAAEDAAEATREADRTDPRVSVLGFDTRQVSAIRETLHQVPGELRKDPRHACYFDALHKMLDALEG